MLAYIKDRKFYNSQLQQKQNSYWLVKKLETQHMQFLPQQSNHMRTKLSKCILRI